MKTESGTLFDISIVKLQRSEEMRRKFKNLIGVSMILSMVLVLPLTTEAGSRSHWSRHSYSSRNHHSGIRIGIGIGLPVLSFARPGVFHTYNYSPYHHNTYRSTNISLWQRGYDDGYELGYRDAARHNNRYHNNKYAYDSRYSYSKSYRSGFQAGYTNGLEEALNPRMAKKVKIYR